MDITNHWRIHGVRETALFFPPHLGSQARTADVCTQRHWRGCINNIHWRPVTWGNQQVHMIPGIFSSYYVLWATYNLERKGLTPKSTKNLKTYGKKRYSLKKIKLPFRYSRQYSDQTVNFSKDILFPPHTHSLHLVQEEVIFNSTSAARSKPVFRSLVNLEISCKTAHTPSPWGPVFHSQGSKRPTPLLLFNEGVLHW